MNEAIRPILDELKARLVELYGERLDRVILYGSQARGDQEEDSDIDVLIVLKGPVQTGKERRKISPITADISLKNTVVISSIIVSDEDYTSRPRLFFDNVRREGVRL